MFITFEGIEGTGKSTQIAKLAERLGQAGRAVTLTREPGGSRIGVELRKILLHMDNQDLCPQAELFLYLADRAQHVAQVVRPALARGEVVLSDRFAWSTVAYQGYGRGLDPELLHRFNETAVDGTWPDLNILLDLDPETGLKRAMHRNQAENKNREEGRFEAEALAFHQRVRQGFLSLAARHSDRFQVVDASRDPEEVFAQVWSTVEPRLSPRSG